ncbi:zinc-dependent peptidase, partial [Xanthomonas campestris pv. campestris]|nr:zinc-dependent peptidase [Xanthomonas campestris pv. campestris]MEB2020945.1 zinc-dependent peptidase [Xanthomonas campestris pv. campestris]
MLRWLRRPPAALDDALWQAVCTECAWVAALDPPRQHRLRALTTQFLQQKTISPVHGLTLTPHDAVLLAATCCLPLLNIGAAGWRGWSQLIVYPDLRYPHVLHRKRHLLAHCRRQCAQAP